ncbi:hypothetical protein T05_8035, partial [Trichinella murrelli]
GLIPIRIVRLGLNPDPNRLNPDPNRSLRALSRSKSFA